MDTHRNLHTGVEQIKTYVTRAVEELNEADAGRRAESVGELFPDKSYPKLRGALNQIVTQYKLAPEIIAESVLDLVDKLSREQPINPTKALYLEWLCRDFAGSERMSPKDPCYLLCQRTLLDTGLSRLLWLVMNGRETNPVQQRDVVLQSGEKYLVEFGTVIYRKSVSTSSHAGGYNGVSVRLASNLYYRFGGYAGENVPTSEFRIADTGFLVLTDRGMIFAGQQTTFRILYQSILRFNAYPDGIGFFQNVGVAREEIFTIVDVFSLERVGMTRLDPMNVLTLQVGWFLFNLSIFLAGPDHTFRGNSPA